ncbi:hypothetical protein [Dyadobacter sp. CY323]|uniref:hypothetical protein n=1 Tax=Dyadobacter sp. CY323 TaxID=2907302 RepID=UPI001F331B84|nr:hypothetical protein [Dyadobacter sp. CY323]MCE6988649.1 hypothetical protein [Dyadobacter sp. CY323]
MKAFCRCIFFLVFCAGCAKQPSLPENSVFNVTSILNDSVWYGTGKVLRLKEADQKMEDVRQFNLLVHTDIDYNGMGGGPNPNTSNGCLDPECTRTQGLVIYNIPLKKGRSNIARLNKRSKLKNEYASLSYIGNAGGLLNSYVYRGQKPGWVRVTKFDKATGIVEGRFAITFTEDNTRDLFLHNIMPPAARFTNGLFRIKITDVYLKKP